MEVAKRLKAHALTIKGKGQLIIGAFAKALEIIPKQLADNAGYDPTDVLTALRRKHHRDDDGTWYGVNIIEGGITDTFDLGVWEPSDNKINSLAAAAEAANVILSIDGEPAGSLDAIEKSLQRIETERRDYIVLLVKRGNLTRFIEIHPIWGDR